MTGRLSPFIKKLICMTAVLSSCISHASENYPSKPINLLVPFAAGGGSDILARLVADGMSRRLGQTIVVNNRPGAFTGIAASELTRAAPDGYTMMIGNTGTFAVNALLGMKMNYDPADLAPIGMVASFPMAYVVPASSPIKSIEDLVNTAKQRSRTGNPMSYASPGIGSPHHLGMEALKYRADIELTHVPYKGVSPAFPDLMTNRIDTMFVDYAAAAGLIKNGDLRVLAVGSAEPVDFLPNVPPMQSLGYKDFQLTGWQALAVPAATPKPIIDKLTIALGDTLKDPEIQRRLKENGLVPNYLAAGDFTKRLAQEKEELGTLIKANKIVAN
jgi:tripartite-type tricarboxylate transporter receptor subunit TctC